MFAVLDPQSYTHAGMRGFQCPGVTRVGEPAVSEQ